MNNKRLIAAGIFVLLLCPKAEARIGITSQFVDVVLEGLQPGQSYNLRELKNIPYVVRNKGDVPMKIAVEIEPPQKTALSAEYEPIPDLNWIRILPNEFQLAAGESHFSEIIVTIPDDPGLIGRHFQAAIWAHGLSESSMAVGVRGRLRFSIGKGPETLRAEKKNKAMLSLDLDLQPRKIYLPRVPIGKHYDVMEAAGRSLTIANRAVDAVQIEFISSPWDQQQTQFLLPQGYQPAPDPKWLTLKPKTQKVKGEQIKRAMFYLDIPDSAAHYGRNYAFLISANIKNQGVPLELYSVICVTIEAAPGGAAPAVSTQAWTAPEETAGAGKGINKANNVISTQPLSQPLPAVGDRPGLNESGTIQRSTQPLVKDEGKESK